MKRKKIFVLALSFLIIFSKNLIANADEDKEKILKVPLREEITNASAEYIKKSVDYAKDIEASAILFEIDTYGGSVDAAEAIKTKILSTHIKTVAYINTKAESAGVLISIACEKIAMHPTATIGSAETIPNTEKVLSMWRSMLRSTAQQRGRDVEVVEAMADKDIYIEGFSEKGKLLNLTATEAKNKKIADYISETDTELIKELGFTNPEIIEYNADISTKILKLLSTQLVSSIILILGFVSIAVELFVPGFGIPGIIGIICFALFFGANILTGVGSLVSVFLFILGIILLLVELVTPGFGVPGITGILLVMFGIGTSMRSMEEAVLAILLSLIISVVVIVVLLKFGFNSRTFDKVMLKASSPNEAVFKNENLDFENINIGDEGISETVLRPSGYIILNGKKFDAISESEWIQKGKKVVVTSIKGKKITVKEI